MSRLLFACALVAGCASTTDARVAAAVRVVDTMPSDAPDSGSLRLKAQAASCVLRAVLRDDHAALDAGAGPECPKAAP